METLRVDFVVVGSGLAGTCAALLLSELGEVALLSKENWGKSNSFAAQGGIAAPISLKDSAEWHIEDTLKAGVGLCDRIVVSRLVTRAPEYIDWLLNVGVSFDRNENNELLLGLEGAHCFPRILHAGGDATGASMIKALSEKLRSHSHICVNNAAEVEALLYSNGIVYGAMTETNGKRQKIIGNKATILATGGLGQLFSATTNPLGAKGEGIALAYEAGAEISNLEFVQFHPTALLGESNPKFLISEAVRGAGAILIDDQGNRVMEQHPLKDLAPRDQVARQIYEVQRNGHQVFIDATSISQFHVKFPTIFQHCLKVGFNPLSTPLPITPAAHFAMGGIRAQITGKTSVKGLYAVGEAACTGVHGANRLASNSLLECVGMAHELAQNLRDCEPLPSYAGSHVEDQDSRQEQPDLLGEVQSVMWKAAGIVRNESRLNWGLARLQELEANNPKSKILTAAALIIKSAIARKESRGAHYRTDYRESNSKFACDTVLRKIHQGEELLTCQLSK